jgi:UDP-glucose 4-epimerase
LHLETRVIVTGGAGFSARIFANKNDANVICIDNYFTSTRRNIDRRSIATASI